MTQSVAASSIFCMTVSCLVGFGIPISLLIFFHKKKKADIPPFLVGCVVMLLFAMILEASVHQIVLSSSAGEVIKNNIWLYALYGGLMAGLFEETGRFVAFKTVLKKSQDKDVNALMYGAGHGGFEALMLLGLGMINNILYSVMINSGSISLLTASLPEEAKAQMQSVIDSLVSSPSYLFLIGSAERIFVVILQISLSVLVFFAAKNKEKWYLFPVSIFLHFFVDAVTALLSGKGISVLWIEIAVGILSLLTALCAMLVWKKNHISEGGL